MTNNTLGIFVFTIILCVGCSGGNESPKEEKVSQDERAEPSPIYKRDREFTFHTTHADTAGRVFREGTLFLTTRSQVISEKHGQTYSSWSSTGGDFGEGKVTLY